MFLEQLPAINNIVRSVFFELKLVYLYLVQGVPEKTPVKEKLITSLTGVIWDTWYFHLTPLKFWMPNNIKIPDKILLLVIQTSKLSLTRRGRRLPTARLDGIIDGLFSGFEFQYKRNSKT